MEMIRKAPGTDAKPTAPGIADALGKHAAHSPLESVRRPTLDTAEAAYYLNRQPQTLRGWACKENGPIRPIRVNGRLAWPVQALRGLLGGAV